MAVKIRIPTPLRGLTKEQDLVPGLEGTLGACIDGLEASFPGIKDRICDDQGEIRRTATRFRRTAGGRFLFVRI